MKPNEEKHEAEPAPGVCPLCSRNPDHVHRGPNGIEVRYCSHRETAAIRRRGENRWRIVRGIPLHRFRENARTAMRQATKLAEQGIGYSLERGFFYADGRER